MRVERYDPTDVEIRVGPGSPVCSARWTSVSSPSCLSVDCFVLYMYRLGTLEHNAARPVYATTPRPGVKESRNK